MFRTLFRIIQIPSVRKLEFCSYLNLNRRLLRYDEFCFNQIRNYAKGKNKLKEDKGKGKKKIEVNEILINEVVDVEKMKNEFLSCIKKMEDIFSQQLAVRTASGALENLIVYFEGHKYTILELGNFNRKTPKHLIINMSAYPQAIPTVMKAILQSGMNLSPQQDGTSISVPLPKVTREHREGLAKTAKAQFVKSRDEIRLVQNKYIKILKQKEKEGLSEDTARNISEQVKYLSDCYISKAEKMLEVKQNELLSVSQ